MPGLGYFLERARGDFWGAVLADSTTSMKELWRVVNKGALAPQNRSGYVPVKISAIADIAGKWRKVDDQATAVIDARWTEKTRKEKGWKISEVLEILNKQDRERESGSRVQDGEQERLRIQDGEQGPLLTLNAMASSNTETNKCGNGTVHNGDYTKKAEGDKLTDDRSSNTSTDTIREEQPQASSSGINGSQTPRKTAMPSARPKSNISVSSAKEDPLPIGCTYWFRVVALLIYVGTPALKDLLLNLFRKAFPQKKYDTLLDALFDGSNVLGKLKSKKKSGLDQSKINEFTSKETFKENTLDITTLTTILTKFQVNEKGHLLLSSEDEAIQNAINDIRNIRNKYMHTGNPQLHKDEFESQWSELKAVITILDVERTYADEIDNWKDKEFETGLKEDIIQRAEDIEKISIKILNNNNIIVNNYYDQRTIHTSPSLTSLPSLHDQRPIQASHSMTSLPSHNNDAMCAYDENENAHFNIQPNALLIIGDENYVDIKITNLDMRIKNISKEGTTYIQVVHLLEKENLKKYSDLCLAVGTHNVLNKESNNKIKSRAGQIINHIRDNLFKHGRLHVLNILPQYGWNHEINEYNARIESVNDFLKEWIDSINGVFLMDTFQAIRNSKDTQTLYRLDKAVLLSTKGKDYIANVIREHIQSSRLQSQSMPMVTQGSHWSTQSRTALLSDR